MRNSIIIISFIFALSNQFGFGENQIRTNLNVEEISLTKWDSHEGIPYRQVPGANLGATSFEVLDNDRIAFLCNSSSEIIIIDKASGNTVKRFNVSFAPRDFFYSGGHFFVLKEDEVIQYDETGTSLGTFSFPSSYVGVERLARVNNSTYLLLPSGDSLIIESDGHSVEPAEREGWITGNGHFIETRLNGNNSYSIKVTTGDSKSYEKLFRADSKVAGVFVVGSTNSRVVLDVQTFISENPISVERTLIVVELHSDGLGAIVANTKVPDSYYVLSNKDFSLREDGTVFNMVTAPQGVFVFSLVETMSGPVQGYPPMVQTKYHFNDHLIQVNNDGNVEATASIPESPQITRTQIINNAIPYTSFTWTATNANIWNGISCGGKIIQTPSWVHIGSNTGMPYAWGGWTATTAIQGYLNSGKSAGDNNTATTFGAEPSCAVGLDCSGFVSRAWALSSKYSTSTLPTISTSISLTQTQPGDILNKVGDHTRLVETNYGNGNYRVIESSAVDWKTSYRTYTAAELTSYNPRHYDGVTGGGTVPGSFTLTLTPECSGTNSQVRLNWTASSGATSYDIYRNGSLYASGIAGTQYINSANITVGANYTYYVQARNAAGSTTSNTQSATAPNCTVCPSPSAIVIGQTRNGSLQSGDCIYTDGSYYDAFTFNGTAGQQIYVTLNSSQFNAYLLLYQGNYPGGIFLTGDNNGGGGTNARIPATSGFFTLPATGSYTILANSLNSGETGSYSLFLGADVGGAGTVQYSSATYNVNENGGNAIITVTRTGGTGAFVVNYGTTGGGTATAGSDYTAVNEVMNFSTNETSKTFTVPIMDDTVVEGNESINLNLSNPSGGVTLGSPSTAVLTIVDNDPGCTYSISETEHTVGPGSVSGQFFMDTQSGCPWTAVSDSPLWLTTSSSGSGDGTVRYNTAVNPSSTSRVGHITVGGQVHTLTQIGVGGAGSVQFSVSNYVTNEEEGIATITVTRTGGTGTGTVSYSTSNGTASAGVDYEPASGLLLFVSDVTSRSFDVTIHDDTVFEGNETINLLLNNQSASLTLGNPSMATLTIVNIDSPLPNNRKFDFDGDGKTDIAIYRPLVGEWWINRSSNGSTHAVQFGNSADKITPGDFTGDGKTDIAFWRPSTGEWFVLRSENFTYYSLPFGINEDIPTPANFDGDGRDDPAVFRPSNATWYINNSSGGTHIQQFGANEDIPVAADYDGDSRADIAIYRPSTGVWWLSRSALGVVAYQFGNVTDKPAPGDYSGDGKADAAFFRPSNGNWFVLRSDNLTYYAAPFGTNGDMPVPGDYDGDARHDFAVWRPSDRNWYLQRSTAGIFIQTFGQSGDRPVPNAFVP